ncbi:hypothetical protein [Nonlabens xiamenensis]|uniref:hypothetical protein n=1 Tax=Nonlabens xiamenensis TaxID=2341043 RepID=UPI000F607C37|nr:hypothetical protein [Nonlabens xiamenensis]
MRIYITVGFLLANFFIGWTQEYEYLGLLKLPDSSLMTYKVSFDVEKGKIKGYSYTDLNGEHETKSSIVGTFNDKDNHITFREVDMIYTKSKITKLDFCYLYVDGTLRKLNNRASINGHFQSYYDDLTPCLRGEIEMNVAERINQRIQKSKRKINRSNRVADSIKEKINLDKMYNRYSKNALQGGETVSLIWPDEYLKLVIWDDGEEDNDQIDLIINGNKILNGFVPVNKKKEMELTLIDPINTISIQAINEGQKPPNTAKVQLIKKNGEVVDLVSQLKKGEKVTFMFYKKNPYSPN